MESGEFIVQAGNLGTFIGVDGRIVEHREPIVDTTETGEAVVVNDLLGASAMHDTVAEPTNDLKDDDEPVPGTTIIKSVFYDGKGNQVVTNTVIGHVSGSVRQERDITGGLNL